MLTILRRTHACKLPVQVFMYDSELAAASRSGSLNKTLDRLSGKEGAAAADITFTAVKKAKQVKGAWKCVVVVFCPFPPPFPVRCPVPLTRRPAYQKLSDQRRGDRAVDV